MARDAKMETLKLDLTYRPIGVIDCLEALVLCIVGKATAVEEYEQEISSPSISYKIPLSKPKILVSTLHREKGLL